MHAIELAGPDLAKLQRTNYADPPPPGPGRVLVATRAASLNFLDLAVATGQYLGVIFPLVPLVDGAGEVVAVGPEVWQVGAGDRVAMHPKPRWVAGEGSAATARAATRGVSLPGSAIQFVEADAAGLIRAPEHLGYEAIAAIPGAAGAAWKALKAGSIGPGSTVVLLGTGGVSIAGLQCQTAFNLGSDSISVQVVIDEASA